MASARKTRFSGHDSCICAARATGRQQGRIRVVGNTLKKLTGLSGAEAWSQVTTIAPPSIDFTSCPSWLCLPSARTHTHTHTYTHTHTHTHDDDAFYLFLQKQKIDVHTLTHSLTHTHTHTHKHAHTHTRTHAHTHTHTQIHTHTL